MDNTPRFGESAYNSASRLMSTEGLLTMLWVKAFHIIAVVTWFAAIFYLPRLFVYHAAAEDKAS